MPDWICQSNLTIEGADEYCGTDCPYSLPICTWLQAGNPIGILSTVISDLQWAATSIATWFNNLVSGSGSNDTAELAEVLLAAGQAIDDPSLVNIAEAIYVASSAAVSEALTEYMSAELTEFLIEVLIIAM